MSELRPFHWSRPLPQGADLTAIRLRRDPAGRYFVSFLVKEEIQPLLFPPQTAGIELGLHEVVTLSTGERTGNEHCFTQAEKRLAPPLGQPARKRKGSKNREKASRKVARLHARIADRRRDFQHKLTTRLIRKNQVVCVESLAVKNLLLNHHLAKAIADVGWGEPLRMLSYKAAWCGRTVVALDRFFPSSKRRSACGHTLDELDLGKRQWACPQRGTVHDRDTNTAPPYQSRGALGLHLWRQVEPKPE
jgi:putative transposase